MYLPLAENLVKISSVNPKNHFKDSFKKKGINRRKHSLPDTKVGWPKYKKSSNSYLYTQVLHATIFHLCTLMSSWFHLQENTSQVDMSRWLQYHVYPMLQFGGRWKLEQLLNTVSALSHNTSASNEVLHHAVGNLTIPLQCCKISIMMNLQKKLLHPCKTYVHIS